MGTLMLPVVTLQQRTGKKRRLLGLWSSAGNAEPMRVAKREVPTGRFNAMSDPTAQIWVVAHRRHWAEAVVVRYDRWHNVMSRKVRTDVVETSVYTSWRALPGYESHDICAYCGCDNTAEGRYGFDCRQCGGN